MGTLEARLGLEDKQPGQQLEDKGPRIRPQEPGVPECEDGFRCTCQTCQLLPTCTRTFEWPPRRG